jgi:hypothetical protein
MPRSVGGALAWLARGEVVEERLDRRLVEEPTGDRVGVRREVEGV